MNRRWLLLISWLMSVFLLFSGCASFKGVAPAGFAPYKKKWGEPFRAISSDGVTYRIKSFSNKPYANLDFWQGAMKKRMVDAGYTVIDSGSVQAGSHQGSYLELASPLGNKDYSYLIALIPKGRKLILVESSGEIVNLKARKKDILEGIAKISL